MPTPRHATAPAARATAARLALHAITAGPPLAAALALLSLATAWTAR